MTIKPSANEGAAGLEWFKISYSTNEGPECVEVADGTGLVHVRDSKRKSGARLASGTAGWTAFVTRVGAGTD
ncbi:DUF397 domain-containing protein [Streptomyces formicae]|uniref:DUF397 domain-containing protein n=1 Tax=Streptomyces formicae TaxID=1616117 RepID=A0A291QHU3_9ACTN|nr:DUF397 domain-containing protein [Streptomyces formicae]ATL31054.1 hypothetical protein KY5_6036c [Streptomyces formicae]